MNQLKSLDTNHSVVEMASVETKSSSFTWTVVAERKNNGKMSKADVDKVAFYFFDFMKNVPIEKGVRVIGITQSSSTDGEWFKYGIKTNKQLKKEDEMIRYMTAFESMDPRYRCTINVSSEVVTSKTV